MLWEPDRHSMTQLKQSRQDTWAALLLQGKHPSLLLPWKGTRSFCLVSLLAGWDAAVWGLSREIDPGAAFPINQQDLQSGEVGALHDLWCDVHGKVPRWCWGVVVHVCCDTIWQGKLQEKAVWRRTSSCPVVLFPGLFVSSQETVSLFLPVLCYCNFSCCWFRCWKYWLLVGTKKPKLKYSIPKTPQKQQCYAAHPFLLDKCQAVVKHNLSAF